MSDPAPISLDQVIEAPPEPVAPEDQRTGLFEIANPDGSVIVAETIVTGKGVGRFGQIGVEPSCQHREFKTRVTVANMVDVEDGPIVAHRLQIRALCGECGQRFGFSGETIVSADTATLGAYIVPIDSDPFG